VTAKELADSFGINFLEVSAKSGQNVDEAFNQLARDIKNRVAGTAPVKQERSTPIVVNTGKKEKKKGPCIIL